MAREDRDSVANHTTSGAARVVIDAHGYPPPSPRIDIGPWVAPGGGGPPPPAVARPAGVPAPLIDLDVATEVEIQALPRIGPALARRIVASRDSAGPFGGLEALRRVRGVGGATLKLLAPLVTFSGQTRR